MPRYFNNGDYIVVDNPKLKTNGCKGTIVGKHYSDGKNGDIWNGVFDVKLEYKGSTLETFVSMHSLKTFRQ